MGRKKYLYELSARFIDRNTAEVQKEILIRNLQKSGIKSTIPKVRKLKKQIYV